MIKLPYRMLIFDIETALLKAFIWRPGDQVIRHNQLDFAHREHKIICIAAKWYGEKSVYVFKGSDAVEEFDKFARKADVCIGKNNFNFDNKHINTARMMQGLKPFPEWMDTCDDLEQQLRKYFAFPSQSLDYISSIMGNGGKDKMEFQDWVDISNYQLLEDLNCSSSKINGYHSMVLFGKIKSQVIKDGQKALDKMIKYNRKDVLDTEAILTKVLPYIKLRKNASNGKLSCTTCGSFNVIPTKLITSGKTRYQQFDCLEHNGYAGKCTYKWNQWGSRKIYTGKMG